MKPLTDNREWPPIAVYDIEAENWVEVTLLGHVDELGNRKTFKTVAAYLDWLYSPEFTSDHVWAHWGGHYDHRFIIHHATINGWNWETIQSGNTIIIVTIKHPNGKEIRFCESARLMPDSVARIGKTVGLAKLDVDRSRIGDLTESEVIEYCLRDCDIVLRGLQYLRKALNDVGADFAYTLASIASRWVRRSDVIDWSRFYNDRDIDGTYSDEMLEADKFCLPAYFGGRVEVFKRGVFKRKLYYYDIRSSYPWSMLQDIPSYFTGFCIPKNRDDLSIIDSMGITDCTVTIPENIHIPVLCLKHKNKLLFPTGKLRGRWTNLELAKAIEQGVKVRIHAQATFEPLSFLRPFVNTFYALRQKSIDEGDSFRSYAYKILLNSLYGKLIESVERTRTIFGSQNVSRAMHMYSSRNGNKGEKGHIRPTHVPGVFSIVSEKDGAFRHVAAGAYVTARSRLRLLEGMEVAHSLGGQVYYCDTDSIVTDVDMGNHPLMRDELGSFKLERTLSEGEFVSPKVYRMVDEKTGENIFKVKGTPVNGKDDNDSMARWKDYISGVAVGKEGISGFVTDMRNGTVAPKKVILARALKSQDTKRDHSGDNSIPLHFVE